MTIFWVVVKRDTRARWVAVLVTSAQILCPRGSESWKPWLLLSCTFPALSFPRWAGPWAVGLLTGKAGIHTSQPVQKYSHDRRNIDWNWWGKRLGSLMARPLQRDLSEWEIEFTFLVLLFCSLLACKTFFMRIGDISGWFRPRWHTLWMTQEAQSNCLSSSLGKNYSIFLSSERRGSGLGCGNVESVFCCLP